MGYDGSPLGGDLHTNIKTCDVTNWTHCKWRERQKEYLPDDNDSKQLVFLDYSTCEIMLEILHMCGGLTMCGNVLILDVTLIWFPDVIQEFPVCVTGA